TVNSTAANTAKQSPATTAGPPVSTANAWLSATTARLGSSDTSGGRTRCSNSTPSTAANTIASGTNVTSCGSARAGHVDCNVSCHDSVSPAPSNCSVRADGSPTTVVAPSTVQITPSRPATSSSNGRTAVSQRQWRHASSARKTSATTAKTGNSSDCAEKTGANSMPPSAAAPRTQTTARRRRST